MIIILFLSNCNQGDFKDDGGKSGVVRPTLVQALIFKAIQS